MIIQDVISTAGRNLTTALYDKVGFIVKSGTSCQEKYFWIEAGTIGIFRIQSWKTPKTKLPCISAIQGSLVLVAQNITGGEICLLAIQKNVYHKVPVLQMR